MTSKVISGGYEACTVAELIAHLQTFDQSLPVIYSLHSDYSCMKTDDVTLARKEDKIVALHRGELRRFFLGADTRGMPDEDFIDAVWFPGN